MYEWLHMCTVGLGESDVFAVFRFAVMAASFLLLAEFGRRGLSRIGRAHVGPWVFLPFCILGALGAIHGLDGVNAAWQYALALPGSALAGWIILVDPHGRRDGRARKIIGFAFLAYDRPGDEKSKIANAHNNKLHWRLAKKAGKSLFGLCGSVGSIGHVHKAAPSLSPRA
jgi:hypothetical protein